MTSVPALTAKDRLKIIIESSTSVVVIETVEEERAIASVHDAAAELNLPVFEWSVADGLTRTDSGAFSGTSGAGQPPPLSGAVSGGGTRSATLGGAKTTGSIDVSSLVGQINEQLGKFNVPPLKVPATAGGSAYGNQPGSQFGSQATTEGTAPPVFNTKEAAQVLMHLQSLTVQGVFILKDMHRQLEDPVVVRLLREVAYRFSRDDRTIVLTAPSIDLPPELQNEIEYLDLPLPDKARLRAIIDEQFRRFSAKRSLVMKLDEVALNTMAWNLSGLTENEAERAVAQAIISRTGLTPDTVTDVLAQKREMLKHTGMLEFVPATLSIADIAGLENLKRWLQKRKVALDPNAAAAGLEPPKGLIVMGVQGCGKSMSARCIAGEWNLPLVKFDASAIFDKYIGETEKRVQKLFRVAEQLAPCVLWIDELEKIFAGSGPDSSSSDAGTSSRLLGAFLSWMQDRTAPVFVAATSNNVNVLPPELLRKGRFDELFFVDLPTDAERQGIFRVHLAKRKQDPSKFDLGALAAASKGFSGAEIEAAVQGSMYAAFTAKQPMTTETVLQEISQSVPLSATRSEDLGALRAWARTRAVPASLPEVAAAGRA